ncbi:hypothetical protein V6N11_060568 [Hibiscus sabdariffa]|uniref:Uncharacterized protein n=1 Tax=Hibiscus sabdariffa TaxID=183260 RepID=A0ABR2QQZ3_9ROSI
MALDRDSIPASCDQCELIHQFIRRDCGINSVTMDLHRAIFIGLVVALIAADNVHVRNGQLIQWKNHGLLV